MVQVEWWRLAIALPAQLLMILWLIFGAWRAAGRLTRASDTADRLIATAVLFLSSSVVVNETIGSVGLLKPAVLFGVNLLVGAIGVWWGRSATRAAITWNMPAPRTAIAFLAVGAGALILPILARAIVDVPVAWDELSYHLFKPAVWMFDGRLSRLEIPFPVSFLTYYPANGELVWTTLVGVLRNDLFVHFLNVPFILVLGLIVVQLSVLTGASRPAAWILACVLLTTPVIIGFAATGYVECVLNLSELAAVLFAIRWLRSEPEHTRSWAVLCGLSAGVALGTKYSTVPVIALLGAATAAGLVWLRGLRRDVIVNGLLGSVAGLLTGAYWYVRNALETHNPFYPVPFAGLPHAERPALPWTGYSILENLGNLLGSGILAKAFFLGREVHAGHRMAPGFGWFGICLFLCSAFGLAMVVDRMWRARRERRQDAATFGILLLMMGITLLTYLRLPYWGNPGWIPSQVRFLTPFVCLSTAAGMGVIEQNIKRRTLIGLAGFGIALNFLQVDLRYPTLTDGISWVVCAGVLVVGLALLRFGQLRWRVVPPIAIALALSLPALLWWREQNRYRQQFTIDEVHFSPHKLLMHSAKYVAEHYSGQKVAVTMQAFEFLYVYTGRWFDIRPIFVAPHNGPVEAYHYPDGDQRHDPDAKAWAQNLRDSGAAALIVAPWKNANPLIEQRWSDELHLSGRNIKDITVYDLAPLNTPPPTAAGRP